MKYLKKKPINEVPEVVKQPGPNDLSERMEFEELSKGVIRIDDAIDEFTTSELMRKINHITSNGIKKIVFFITSPGGSIYHSLALYDRIIALKNVGVRTEAYVEGMAASAASMIILQAIEKRYATPNSRFLIHEPRRFLMFASERASEMQENTKEITVLSEIIINIMLKRCKLNKKKLLELINRKETWLSSKEAKKIGLVDEIAN